MSAYIYSICRNYIFYTDVDGVWMCIKIYIHIYIYICIYIYMHMYIIIVYIYISIHMGGS